MGNNVCCEQHNTEDKAMDQLQPQTTDPKHSAIRSDKVKRHTSSLKCQKSNITVKSEKSTSLPPNSLKQPSSVSTPKVDLICFRIFPCWTLTAKKPSNPSVRLRYLCWRLRSCKSPSTQHKKPHGLGRMYKPNGNLYVGYFQNGKAQGKGVFLFADSSYYRGDFNNNQAETKNGEYVSDHLNYRGGFRNNKFEG